MTEKRPMTRLALAAMIVLLVLPNIAAHAQVPVQLATVVRVLDGDTIDVEIDGETYGVRYIGVNSPERDEVCGDSATNVNTSLLAGKTVALVRDVSDTDQHGRLLRYVYARGTFVNAFLVAGGWAESARYPPDTTFADFFDYLENEARAAGVGCHPMGTFGLELPSPTPVPAAPESRGVTISAPGNVNIRSGPGTSYPVVASLRAGEIVQAQGRDQAGDWLMIVDGQWLAAWVVTVEGDIDTLPVYLAPPTPTR